MLNFSSIMINTENLDVLVKFYKKVFNKEPEMSEDGYAGFVVGNGFFGIGFHDKIHGKAKDADRVLFNFETTEVKDEFERVSKIEGVTVVKEPYSMGDGDQYWVSTLADPDGNLFQLVSPWDDGGKN